MNPLEKHITNTYQEIKQLSDKVQKDLDDLLNKTFEINLLLVRYKAETKSYFSRNVSTLFDTSISEAMDALKRFKICAKRNKIDRVSLESLGVINKPQRKNPNRRVNSKPVLLEVGEYIAKIRDLNEKGMSAATKNMTKVLLTQLQKDL